MKQKTPFLSSYYVFKKKYSTVCYRRAQHAKPSKIVRGRKNEESMKIKLDC